MRVSYRVLPNKKWAVKICALNFVLIKFIFRDPTKVKKTIKWLQFVSVPSFESPPKKKERKTVCSGPPQYEMLYFLFHSDKKKSISFTIFFLFLLESIFVLGPQYRGICPRIFGSLALRKY